jgi:hypothetical protein
MKIENQLILANNCYLTVFKKKGELIENRKKGAPEILFVLINSYIAGPKNKKGPSVETD